MTPREKILEQIIKEIFWMARRYAHGRHTYAPGIIRDAYNVLKKLGVDIEHDDTIKPPEKPINTWEKNDYLDDVN